MKVIGIIAEYNPFHNGHLYQINKVKELYPDSIIITVISSSFSQRGEAIILDKWERTDITLNNKVDLVVELPYPFSTQSADTFAKGGVSILNALKIDTLVFGTESGSIDDLVKAAEIQINNKNFDKKVKEYIDKKYNYKTSVAKTIFDLTNINLETPNDILGVSYIKEVLRQNKNIEIKGLKRTNNYLDLSDNSNIVSASNIRNKIINNKRIKKYVPAETYKQLKNISINEDLYFNLLKYKILTTSDLHNYVTIDEGIENRIKSAIFNSNSLEELIENIKTKRYTPNKIRRSLCHILNNFTKELKKEFEKIEYIRILGFNEKGKNYLNSIKKGINLPIITNYKKGYKMLDYEMEVTSVYNIVMNKKLNRSEYSKKPTML